VTLAAPLWPWLVAVIVTCPTATPVTMPSWDTVATVVSLVAHVTGWSVGFPAESSGVAVSHTTCCSITLADSGLTATDAAVAGGGGGGGGVARVDSP